MSKSPSCGSICDDPANALKNARPDAAPHNDCNMDVDVLAKLFQALQFTINSTRVCEPSVAEELATEAEASGIRVTVMCLKSRQEVVLQRTEQECSCKEIEDKGFWEVVATSGSKQSLIERTSGVYPPLKSDAAMAVKHLMGQVGAIASGKGEVPSVPLTLSAAKRRSERWQRLSLGSGENRPAGLHELALKYRSLDTLIDDNVVCPDLPKPGVLLKPGVDNKAISDSQIALPAAPSSPPAAIVLSHLQMARDNINKAISLYSQEGAPRLGERKTPRREANLSAAKSSLDTRKTLSKSTEVLRPRMIRPCSITPSEVKSTPRLAPKVSVGAASKKPVGTATTSTGTAASKKYAHVKSTIPKPAPRN